MSGTFPGLPHLTFFGGYDPDYPRNRIIRNGLIKIGCKVSSCRVNSRWKVHHRYPALLTEWLRMKERGHIIFVPDFRHKDVPLAWLLAKMSRRKLVFDPLVSRYVTRALDRRDINNNSPQAWHNLNIDRISMKLPHLVLADTESHAGYYRRIFNLPSSSVRVLYLGYDDSIFRHTPLTYGNSKTRILFYGSYLPLHGVETIVEAARLLDREDVVFNLVGGGQTYPGVREKAEYISGERINFIPEVNEDRLCRYIADSDIVLGIFGRTPKAGMVIPNKVYQAMAVGRVVITSDTSAIRECFEPGEHLITVPAGDPVALNKSIKRLLQRPDLRRKLAEQGGRYVRRRFNPVEIASNLIDILKSSSLRD